MEYRTGNAVDSPADLTERLSLLPPGHGSGDTTYSVIYNRLGYVLLILIALECFLPQPARKPSDSPGADLASGVLLGIAFFCKATYFAFGAGLVVVGCWFVQRPVNRLVRVAVGFAAVAFGFYALLGVSTSAYLADFLSAGGAQDIAIRLQNLSRALTDNLLSSLVLLAALAIGLKSWPASGDGARDRRLRFQLLAGVVLLCPSGFVLTSLNHFEGADLPTFFACGVLIVNAVARAGTHVPLPRWRDTLPHLLVLALVGLFFYVPIVGRDVLSIYRPLLWSQRADRTASVTPFDNDRLSGFEIPSTARSNTSYSTTGDTPARINDGLRLLAQHAGADARLSCLCYTNPFTFALGLPPAPGTPLWMFENFSFSRQHYPDAHALFENVDILLVPLQRGRDDGFGWETVELMDELYGEFLGRRFAEVARSEMWLLLERAGLP